MFSLTSSAMWTLGSERSELAILSVCFFLVSFTVIVPASPTSPTQPFACHPTAPELSPPLSLLPLRDPLSTSLLFSLSLSSPAVVAGRQPR